MTYKGKVQYVRYNGGSTARKPAAEPVCPNSAVPRKAELPGTAKKTAPKTVVIEPFAVIGTVIAVVLAVCVAVGAFRLHDAGRREARMEDHVAALTEENKSLRQQYRSGYDPEEVRLTAEVMGLVPKEQVQHIKVTIPKPAPEPPEPTFWEHFWAEVRELFA